MSWACKEVWWKRLEHPIYMGRLYNDLPLPLLCGLATKTNTYLWAFRGRAIYPILDDLGVICVGDSSLIRYLTSHVNLFWQFEDGGVTAATYLLTRAEQFVDGYGGPMDLVVLRQGPRINVIDQTVIEDIDKQLAENHEKAFRTLLALSAPFSI